MNANEDKILLDEETESALEDNKSEKAKTNLNKIKELENQINLLSETDYKNKIHLNGKLISLYKKQVSLETKQEDKMKVRYQLLELQKYQKELTKNYKKSNTNIPIKEKVALTIKDIANTIDIFLNEKDVLTKLKDIIVKTGTGSLTSGAVIAAIAGISALVVGIPFSLTSLAGILPVTGYIALSNVIRNLITKTPFQEFQYYQSEEFKELVKQFKEENKETINQLNSLSKEKSSCTTTEEKLQMNQTIISKLDEIASNAKDQGLRRTYELDAYALMKENKQLCKKVIDDYLDERSNNKERYHEYQRKLLEINKELFVRGNSIKEAILNSGKEAGISLAVMVMAKALIKVISPTSSYGLNGIHSLIIPLALTLTSAIANIPTYSNKLKYVETEEEKEIKPKDKEKLNNLFNQLKLQAAY